MESLFVLPDVVPGPSGLSSSTLGHIAELRAEAELLERGHKVARPVVDEDGVDFVVDYRLVVQVKSATLKRGGNGSVRWEFEFRMARKDGYRAASSSDRGRLAAHVDFFLFYARDDRVWWVVPRSSLRATVGRFRITPGGRNDLSFREAWGQLSGG